MRLVLFNAHEEMWFGKTVKKWLYRTPWKAKYAFVVRERIRRGEPIYILTGTNVGESMWARTRAWLHVKLWAMANGYSPRAIKPLFSPESLTPADALLVIYVGNFVLHSGPKAAADGLVAYLNRCRARIFLNVNHYPYHADAAEHLLRDLRFDYFWAENDLRTNSSFFRKHFASFGQPFMVSPFAVRPVFENVKPFVERRHSAIAVGTVSLKMTDDRAFVGHFGHDNLQPIREAIFNGIPAAHAEHLHTAVSHINEGGAGRPVRGVTNPVVALRNWLHNVFRSGQRKYHTIDMSALFNTYKAHVIGEEVVGLPGIGFAEGMMCGTVFVGIDDPMYRIHGLEPNIHYVAYSGGYPELLARLEEVLRDDAYLQSVSDVGCAFAKSHFREDLVYGKLIRMFAELPATDEAKA